jgi:HEAT repeat protein
MGGERKIVGRIMLGATVSVILASSGLILLFVAAREPVHKGRPVSDWIYRLDPDVNARARHDEAAEELRRIGQPVVPVIRGILEEPRGRLAPRAKKLLQRLRIVPPDAQPLKERQYRAARAAYQLAEWDRADISSLAPSLVPHVTSSNYLDTEAGRALAAAGPEGVAALTNLFVHPDARVRDRAIVSLYHARDKPGVLEAFLRVVDDPSRDVRFAALGGLSGRAKIDPNIAVPIGLRFVEKPDRYERWAGASLLAAYAEDPRAFAALRKALQDPDATVRRVAERAVMERDK